MKYTQTTATKKIAGMTKRIRALQGGTAASKTISALIYLIAKAQTDKIPTLTSVVSESFPHLKRGAIRDFLNIMEGHGYFKTDRWNKTDYTYTFETGSKMEFFSVDQPGKVRGPRRQRLFGNEINNWSNGFEIFEQLEVRTTELVIVDWNPTNEFWFYENILPRDDCELIILTYLDNEASDQSIVNSIESRKDRKQWWKVYGEGQLGEVEGKIYKDWDIIDEVPHHARLERYGVDFGYSNDPTAIVAVYYYQGGYIIDEIAFKTHMFNSNIADVIEAQETPGILIVADSAEPKSIAEIKLRGINIIACEKGADSVRNGIQLVQDQPISVTKRSLNIIKAYRNYMWDTDKEGKILNVPNHDWSDAMDAVRYALTQLIKKPTLQMAKASEGLGNYYDEIGL